VIAFSKNGSFFCCPQPAAIGNEHLQGESGFGGIKLLPGCPLIICVSLKMNKNKSKLYGR
jgi:hypothetical protein